MKIQNKKYQTFFCFSSDPSVHSSTDVSLCSKCSVTVNHKVTSVPLYEPGLDVNPVNVNAVKRKFSLHVPELPLFEAA